MSRDLPGGKKATGCAVDCLELLGDLLINSSPGSKADAFGLEDFKDRNGFCSAPLTLPLDERQRDDGRLCFGEESRDAHRLLRGDERPDNKGLPLADESREDALPPLRSNLSLLLVRERHVSLRQGAAAATGCGFGNCAGDMEANPAARSLTPTGALRLGLLLRLGMRLALDLDVHDLLESGGPRNSLIAVMPFRRGSVASRIARSLDGVLPEVPSPWQCSPKKSGCSRRSPC